MYKAKIYLAGPEVFFPSAIEIGQKHKLICKKNGYIGLYPLDNCIEETTPEKTAKAIVEANINLINESDIVLANLSNFRGSKTNPSCDSGTAWECGYALAKGKKVIAYTNNLYSIPDKITNYLDLTIISKNFKDLFLYLNTIALKSIHITYPQEKVTDVQNLDPISSKIQDANAYSAFILGYRYGKGLSCRAYLSDMRPQIQKYGPKDAKGNSVENFGYSVNIMIACNTEIILNSKN